MQGGALFPFQLEAKTRIIYFVSFAIIILEMKFLRVQNGMLFYCKLQSTPFALFVIQSWDWKG